MTAKSQVDEILQFVKTADFSGYQKLTLPDGTVIPGQDRSVLADLLFPERLDGKTVLDVGCYYGYFLHNAVQRGAARAVGIEADPARYAIASKLAPLWGDKVDVLPGIIESVDLAEQFDYVLFLRVLHHVADPAAVMRRLVSSCRDQLIVEFREPHDPQFIAHARSGRMQSVSALDRISDRVHSRLYRWLTHGLPIIGVGSAAYHRGFYLNRKAFRNMFCVHHQLFTQVTFTDSSEQGSSLAFCQCAARGS